MDLMVSSVVTSDHSWVGTCRFSLAWSWIQWALLLWVLLFSHILLHNVSTSSSDEGSGYWWLSFPALCRALWLCLWTSCLAERSFRFWCITLVSVLWPGLVVLETLVLAVSSCFFVPNFFLILSALAFFTLVPFWSSSVMEMFVLSFFLSSSILSLHVYVTFLGIRPTMSLMAHAVA